MDGLPLGCGRNSLRLSGSFLTYIIHITNGLYNLPAAGRQLLHGCGNFLNLAGNLVDESGYLLERFTGQADDVTAYPNLAGTGFHRKNSLARITLNFADQVGYLLGRSLRLFGQFPHFLGNNGKAAALLTGPGGFNGGIERIPGSSRLICC